MYPAQALNERVAADDDVIPLKYPTRTVDGELVQSIKVQKGQVCAADLCLKLRVLKCFAARYSMFLLLL